MRLVIALVAFLVVTPAVAFPTITFGPGGITIGPSHPDWRHRGHPYWREPNCWRRDWFGNRRWVCGEWRPGWRRGR